MSQPKAEGCVKPSKGLIKQPAENTAAQADQHSEFTEEIMQARVGQEAPDFEVIAYFNGDFKEVKLSDYRGKWVMVCFYPGDFTFV